MIKVETVGMIQNAKVNPVLKSDTAVKNYGFVTVDGELYVVCNSLLGDEYAQEVEFKAGEHLNGWLVREFDGQKLVADAKHFAESFAPEVGNFCKVSADKLVKADTEPDSGVYFKVVGVTRLTEKAYKLLVVVK